MASHLKIMNKRMVLLNPRFVKKHQSNTDENNAGGGVPVINEQQHQLPH
jgi:hypothetical protein